MSLSRLLGDAGGTMGLGSSTKRPAVRTTERRLKRQKQVASEMIVPQGMTYLEARSVKQPTIEDYGKRFAEFKDWVSIHQIAIDTAEQMDLALVEILQEMFDVGRGINDGIRVVAAVKVRIQAAPPEKHGHTSSTVQAYEFAYKDYTPPRTNLVKGPCRPTLAPQCEDLAALPNASLVMLASSNLHEMDAQEGPIGDTSRGLHGR
eukprot:Skav202697  [mRNA]  locus=scaffold654:248534:257976:- [translate_table: standard]